MKEPPASLDRLLVLPDNFNTEEMLEKIQHRNNRRYQSNHSHTPTQTGLKEET